ncbi:MAG TPA: PAS domain-containing protein [Methylophaga sp.]|nr:PAS domain-containing protein [Methylophaga sp.]HEC59197.1 PAS domain-containing protein [Methylophaga sp.]
MTLLLLCMATLSTIFMITFGMWWENSAPFTVHMTALIMFIVTIFSLILLITVYPILRPRFTSNTKHNNLDHLSWCTDASSKLSTPAAVLRGYTVIFTNNMFLDELGLSGSNDQVIGMPITNLVHPSEHDNLAQMIAMSTGALENNEITTIRMLYVDGTSIPVHISLSPLQQSGESNLNLLQFTTSSHHKAVASPLIDQFDSRFILDSVEQIMFQINVDQQLIFINPSWERMLDYTLVESINKSLLSFIHPEDTQLFEARLGPLSRGQRKSCHLQTRLIAKNGCPLWVEMRASTASSLKGEFTSVIGSFTDISRMKQTEISMKANRKDPIDMILSGFPSMVYRCKNDRSWSFEFTSDGCLELTEYEAYEIAKSPGFSYMQIIHEQDKTNVWEYVQQQILKEQKFQLIYRIITRTGKIKWVLEQGQGIYSSTGDLLSLEGLITQISHANSNINPALLSLQSLLVLPENQSVNYYMQL